VVIVVIVVKFVKINYKNTSINILISFDKETFANTIIYSRNTYIDLSELFIS